MAATGSGGGTGGSCPDSKSTAGEHCNDVLMQVLTQLSHLQALSFTNDRGRVWCRGLWCRGSD